MIEEIIINSNMPSIVSDPWTIRTYTQQHGEENFAIYGLPGFLVADVINEKTAEKVLQSAQRAKIYEKPIGTLYCAGIRSSDYAITDSLKVAKLEGDVNIDDSLFAINELSVKKEYFAGSSITGMPGGVFTTIAHYYSNLLTDEELKNYSDIFKISNNEVSLSEKGEYILEILKETWDYTSRSIRSLCKIDVKLYLSELFNELKEISLKELEDYIREKRTIRPEEKNKLTEDCKALARLLEDGLSNKYMRPCEHIYSAHSIIYGLITELKSFDNSKDIGSLKIVLERLPEAYTIIRDISNSPKIQNIALQKLLKYAKVPSKKAKKIIYQAFDGWKNSLIDRIEDLKNKVSQADRYSTIYSNIVIRQLELLEKGEYIQIKRHRNNQFELLEEPYKYIKVIQGQNFKYLDYVGVFCPMGLSQKWDTWKIEQGPILRLTKYCKNVMGDLFRMEIDTLGAIMIDGSGESVFDEITKNDLNMIEELINYGCSNEDRKALKWETMPAYTEKPGHILDKTTLLSKVHKKEYPKPSAIHRLTRSDEHLLRNIRR